MNAKVRAQLMSRKIVWLIIAYSAVTVVWAVVAYEHRAVTLKAALYGCLLNLRFLVFFLVTWTLALRTARMQKGWQKLVLIPAAIVIVIGILQAVVLPHDVLRHFGYSPSTIPVLETINHNSAYMRVQSTLRGANPLGAYLLVPLSVVMVYLFKRPRDWRLWAFLAAGLFVLFFTFSRSAWLGFVISAVFVMALQWWNGMSRRWLYVAVGFFVLIAGATALSLHRSSRIENIVLHTQTHSAVATTSNQGHVAALKTGVRQTVHEPLGRGPGSAGPASVYNGSHPVRIAENYYLQVGQEVGWIGLGLFVLIQVGVGYLLWKRRCQPFGLSLLAAFIGISIINMLSHAWTDDTTAYLWWGLAGVAMVSVKPAKTTKPRTVKKVATNGKNI